MEEILNKVALSEIEQVDLKQFLFKDDLVLIDLKDQLWEGLVLKEKDFRNWIQQNNWDIYTDKTICVFCSTDAIIPSWAYMLLVAKLTKAKAVYFGNEEHVRSELFYENLKNWDVSSLSDKKVMVKGCSTVPQPNKAFLIFTQKLIPVVKSLMFGEPCSAVPVYKRKV